SKRAPLPTVYQRHSLHTDRLWFRTRRPTGLRAGLKVALRLALHVDHPGYAGLRLFGPAAATKLPPPGEVLRRLACRPQDRRLVPGPSGPGRVRHPPVVTAKADGGRPSGSEPAGWRPAIQTSSSARCTAECRSCAGRWFPLV